MSIEELRKSQGFTQAELGKKVGVSQRTISNYESGERHPSRRVASRFCELFHLTKEQAWDIFGRVD